MLQNENNNQEESMIQKTSKPNRGERQRPLWCVDKSNFVPRKQLVKRKAREQKAHKGYI